MVQFQSEQCVAFRYPSRFIHYTFEFFISDAADTHRFHLLIDGHAEILEGIGAFHAISLPGHALSLLKVYREVVFFELRKEDQKAIQNGLVNLVSPPSHSVYKKFIDL